MSFIYLRECALIAQGERDYQSFKSQVPAIGEFVFSCEMEDSRFQSEGIDFSTLKKIVQVRHSMGLLVHEVQKSKESLTQEINNQKKHIASGNAYVTKNRIQLGPWHEYDDQIQRLEKCVERLQNGADRLKSIESWLVEKNTQLEAWERCRVSSKDLHWMAGIRAPEEEQSAYLSADADRRIFSWFASEQKNIAEDLRQCGKVFTLFEIFNKNNTAFKPERQELETRVPLSNFQEILRTHFDRIDRRKKELRERADYYGKIESALRNLQEQMISGQVKQGGMEIKPLSKPINPNFYEEMDQDLYKWPQDIQRMKEEFSMLKEQQDSIFPGSSAGTLDLLMNRLDLSIKQIELFKNRLEREIENYDKLSKWVEKKYGKAKSILPPSEPAPSSPRFPRTPKSPMIRRRSEALLKNLEYGDREPPASLCEKIASATRTVFTIVQHPVATGIIAFLVAARVYTTYF